MATLPNLGIDPSFQMPAPKPSGGMFGGGKFGVKEALAFGLAGLVSRRNPMLLQALMGAMMQKQKDAREESQYQRERGDKRSDFLFEQDYKLAHPGVPDLQGRIDTLNHLRPGLGDTYAGNYAATGGGQMVQFVDPSTGQRYMMPQGGPQLPQIGSVIDDPRKAGGQTPQASGGFPRY